MKGRLRSSGCALKAIIEIFFFCNVFPELSKTLNSLVVASAEGYKWMFYYQIFIPPFYLTGYEGQRAKIKAVISLEIDC